MWLRVVIMSGKRLLLSSAWHSTETLSNPLASRWGYMTAWPVECGQKLFAQLLGQAPKTYRILHKLVLFS